MENKALLDRVLESLEERVDGAALADRAAYSRFHFHRLFLRAFGETPAVFRRRLRLERAAWQLLKSEQSVTEIAFDSGYGSLEAFSRAFQRSYGVTPSLFRRIAPPDHLLAAPNRVHYRPSGVTLPGDITMDLLDRLLTHDEYLTGMLLDKAGTIPEESLDKLFGQDIQLLCYEPPQRSARDLFHSLLMDKEVWLSVLKGWPFPDKADRSLAGLKERHAKVYPAFRQLAQEIRDEGRWDETFVDQLCSPPETFPYGGMISFVLFCGSHRSQLLLAAMKDLGVEVDFGAAYGQLMAIPAPAAAK